MTEQTDTTQTGDAPADPPPPPPPGHSAADWAAAQEQSMHNMIDKLAEAFSATMSEPATRAERIAVALLGMHPPAPGDAKPGFAASLAKMAHDIAAELDKLEAAADVPTVEPAAPEAPAAAT